MQDFMDELKREFLMQRLVKLNIGQDKDGTPITQLTNRELSVLIAVSKIKNGVIFE